MSGGLTAISKQLTCFRICWPDKKLLNPGQQKQFSTDRAGLLPRELVLTFLLSLTEW